MLGMRPKHVLVALLVIALYVISRVLAHHSSTPMPSPTAAPASSPAATPASATTRNGRDVPVPQSCAPDVNQKLAELLAQHATENVDNVMVCGTTISPSRTQHGGEHGSHEILPLLVNLPGAGSKQIQVVTNDDLDGVVTAPKDALVFAYGQAFFDQGSRYEAGIHDVHCATHRGADNGWVVVNGAKSPTTCAARR
jgi:hypothetical protein